MRFVRVRAKNKNPNPDEPESKVAPAGDFGLGLGKAADAPGDAVHVAHAPAGGLEALLIRRFLSKNIPTCLSLSSSFCVAITIT